MFKEIETKRVLIFGCGNVLLGDDGFGPAVIERLRERGDLPDDAHPEDVGTSIRGILFDIALLDRRPEHIIVLDAVDKPERAPGEVFEISVDEIPEKKIADYSFHQFPTTNLLKELQDASGIRVTIVAAQTAAELEEVRPGLSEPMRSAVTEAADLVIRMLRP
ncbi:MAG: hydrogenase maturation protease [bacterium]|nr:hydrogenase maturation protease [bacterium]